MNRKLKMHELGRMTPVEFATAPKIPLIVVLDNIRSGNNVGSVFRTSDAFRLEEVILGGITVKPPHRDIMKTALGADEHVAWSHYEDLLPILHNLKSKGYKIASVEQVENSVSLEKWSPAADEKWCVVMGNEVAGVSDEVVSISDICIEVPQFGSKHSLNIAVCTGMVFWQYMVQSGFKQLAPRQ
jgi:23S rRNA (guanosine2251-2'-O)-methyltransferase